MSDWHTLDRDALLRRLDSRPEGLTDAEAAERLERLGPNQLQERHGRSPLAVFAGNACIPRGFRYHCTVCMSRVERF